jgi:hypothetical protein
MECSLSLKVESIASITDVSEDVIEDSMIGIGTVDGITIVPNGVGLMDTTITEGVNLINVTIGMTKIGALTEPRRFTIRHRHISTMENRR